MSSHKPTAAELGKLAKVSQSTVSLVLTGKWEGRVSKATADRILTLARKTGYRPNPAAQSLRLGSSKTILFLIPVLSNPFFARVYGAIAEVAKDNNLTILVYPMQTADDGYPLQKVIMDVDAIISCSLDSQNIQPMGNLIPTVFIDCNPLNARYTVNADIYNGTTKAIKKLINTGFKRIYHFACIHSKWTFNQRLTAVNNACPNNIELHRVSMIPSAEEAYRNAECLLKKTTEKIGFFCDNDTIAEGVLFAAFSLNKSIPSEISIIGMDDKPDNHFSSKGLSSVKIDAEMLGAIAMQNLLELMEKKTPKSIIIPTQLVERSTTIND